MRTAVQYIVSKTCKPVLLRYLSRTRIYSWRTIKLEITRGIFHPGFFFSTKLLLRYILKKNFKERSVLELGAGSGLLSIYAARQGARVLATDISPSAIACLAANRARNNVSFEILQSDLFDKVEPRIFDLILINPPYYKKEPVSYEEYAWYCGENGEYFEKLFSQLRDHIHENTEVLMVLCEGCDIEMIRQMATNNHLEMVCVQTSNNLIEDNYIFSIKRQVAAAIRSVVKIDTTDKKDAGNFEKIYHAVRTSEKRIYSDVEVYKLPQTMSPHRHKREWQIRKHSSDRLITYLSKRQQHLQVLEIGCGNGWLCHQLATRLSAEVTGVDAHLEEVNQATRVFAGISRLRFVYGNGATISFGEQKFDTIIFAASIHYFPSLVNILHKAISMLNPGGEIHILDSRFYKLEETGDAQQRSRQYFRQLGFEEMSGHYYHHTMDSLQEFDHTVLYDPSTFLNRLVNKRKPFYWLMIKANK